MNASTLLASGGFISPGSHDFVFKPLFGNNILFTKPVFQAFLAAILVAVFFLVSSRKAAVVPSRTQFFGESVYSFVKKDLGEDIIGHEFMKFVPFLFSLFTFIIVNNIFGIVPFMQFPTMSRFGFPVALMIFTYVIYHYVGIRKHGLGKYLKDIAFVPGVPKWIYVILTPLEIATYFIIRPFTLAIRLFANMFAGHLLLLVFIMGGDYMLHNSMVLKIMSPLSFGFGIGLTFFEFFIECLQAYIFTLLTALYIAGAIADEH